jgi:hypothetical protein
MIYWMVDRKWYSLHASLTVQSQGIKVISPIVMNGESMLGGWCVNIFSGSAVSGSLVLYRILVRYLLEL